MNFARLFRALGYILLAIICVWCLFPILWAFLISIQTEADAFSIPPKLLFTPTMDNYRVALSNPDLLRYFVNSTITALGATTVCTAFSLLSAYAAVRSKSRKVDAAVLIILVTSMLPSLGALVPVFLIYHRVGLYDTQVGLMAMYMVMNSALAIWMLRSTLEGIPFELEESAMVDGCTKLGAFVRVALPLAAPGIAACVIVVFIFCWNEFMQALVLTGANARTLPLSLASYMGRDVVNWGPICAVGVLVMLPVIVFALLVQRKIVEGLTLGAVKA